MLIDRGRVAALGREALASGAPRHELPGLWLSPAPLDTHVHLDMRGEPYQALAASHEAGLAAVRDLGRHPRNQPPDPGAGPPLVVAAGVGLGPQGPARYWLAEDLAGAGAFARAVEQRASNGSGVIKLFATGLLDPEQVGRVLHPVGLEPAEVRAAVQAAHAAGLKVAVHASGEAGVNLVLDQGVDCLEHGFFLGPDTMERLAGAGTYWAPTLAPIVAHAQDPDGRWDESARQGWAGIAQRQMDQVRLAAGLGVKLVLGSDAGSYGVPHGRGAFMEMAAWLEAGVEPDEVFAAATSRAAQALGLEDEVGGMFPGAKAWLLATRQDPRANPLELARPAWRSF